MTSAATGSPAEAGPMPKTIDGGENPADTSDKVPEEQAIYGSLWVGSLEFAMPVRAIREVVNEPNAISTVPLAPPFLKGLFNLRGLTIPIVDLRSLLELPIETREEGGCKIAIIEHGDKCVGVLFDRAGEVLNKPTSAHVNFKAPENSTKGGVVNGVLTLDGGNRMVQTIDPHKLIHMEQVPHTEVSDFRSSRKRNLGKRLSCVSFKFGQTHCAIDLRYVQEVKEMPAIEKSALAHGYVIGTVNLRGTVIPVVDFLSFMQAKPMFDHDLETSKERKLLVMQSSEGLIGLMVVSINSIIPYFENEVVPFSNIALPRSGIVKGSLTDKNNDVVLLLDHDQLMSEEELVEAAKTCKDAHEIVESETQITKEAAVQERHTFILFSIDNHFAMNSKSVIEIINMPSEIVEPSYAMDFVEGIIHLRGELIILINLRSLYGLDEAEHVNSKVLIFTHNSQKYAISVDSVDEIITTTAENIIPKHEVGHPAISSSTSKVVSGVVRCSRKNGEKQMVMIMDGSALVEQCAQSANCAVQLARKVS